MTLPVMVEAISRGGEMGVRRSRYFNCSTRYWTKTRSWDFAWLRREELERSAYVCIRVGLRTVEDQHGSTGSSSVMRRHSCVGWLFFVCLVCFLLISWGSLGSPFSRVRYFSRVCAVL